MLQSSILKFAPSKVVWGLFDTEKKLYMCPFGQEPIAGTKMQELFPGLEMGLGALLLGPLGFFANLVCVNLRVFLH